MLCFSDNFNAALFLLKCLHNVLPAWLPHFIQQTHQGSCAQVTQSCHMSTGMTWLFQSTSMTMFTAQHTSQPRYNYSSFSSLVALDIIPTASIATMVALAITIPEQVREQDFLPKVIGVLLEEVGCGVQIEKAAHKITSKMLSGPNGRLTRVVAY